MYIQQSDKPKKYGIIVFFAMTYLFSWIVWIPIALSSQKIFYLQFSPYLGIIIGGFGPFLTALILTMAEQGWPGIKSLFKRLLQWQVGIQWYIFILLFPAAIIFTAVFITSLLANEPINIPNIGDWRVILLVFIVTLFIGGPIGEELGWRGYALPKLEETRNSLLASLIVGLGWGMWHLPLFWIQGSLQAGIPLLWFMVSILAESVVYTWIYNSNGGSLLLMVLLHTSINAWAKLLLLPAITNSLSPMLITFSLEVFFAFILITIIKPVQLNKQ
jgi:uncharacterized protein